MVILSKSLCISCAPLFSHRKPFSTEIELGTNIESPSKGKWRHFPPQIFAYLLSDEFRYGSSKHCERSIFPSTLIHVRRGTKSLQRVYIRTDHDATSRGRYSWKVSTLETCQYRDFKILSTIFRRWLLSPGGVAVTFET